MQAIRIKPNAEPEEVDCDINAIIDVLSNNRLFWRVRPFGDEVHVRFASDGQETGKPFNRIIVDANGQQTIAVYGEMYLLKQKLPDLTDDEVAMYKKIFSLEECSKPIEERIKLIKSYFPNSVDSDMKMPDDYQDATPVTPSYTRPAVPVKGRSYVPHCPICGSPDIEKITLAQKAFGGFMFGLLSKTARSQFKCNNCGAKF